MSILKVMQMISNFSFVYIIGFPLIIMGAKAVEWERESGKRYSLRIFNGIFIALLVSSTSLFNRIELTAAFALFGLMPTLALFQSQIKEFEPSFNLMSILKTKKSILLSWLFQ